MRTILHVDMDAFFASVEQRDHPEWRGKPVIVGADPHRRGVVSTCSYEARVFGIHSAMPSREAFRLCPEGIYVPPDIGRYEEASRRVFAVFSRFSPFIEPLSIDEAFIDVSGVGKLFGTGGEIARKIKSVLLEEVGLPASIGVAPNKFLAKLASEAAKPNGIFTVPGDPREQIAWLGKLPVKALWGVGRVTGDTLMRAGFKLVADIQSANPQRLESLLGRNSARHLMALAFGRDDREVQTATEEKSISKEYTFGEDCENREEVRAVLKQLCGSVGHRLRERGFYASVGRLKLRWKDFTTLSRQAPFDPPVCDDFALHDLAFRLFDAIPMTRPVRLIGFGVGGLSTEREEQLTLFPEQGELTASELREKKERLCKALDALRTRFPKQD